MDTRNLLRTFTRVAASPLPLPGLLALSGQKVILPFYHAVSDDPPPHLRHVLKTRDTRTFRHDLDWLCRHFEPIDAPTLEEIATGRRAPTRPSFHLSFDDGLKEAATIIAPLLKERGIPATFFLNTGFIGQRDLFFRFRVSVLISRLDATGETARKKAATLLAGKGILAPTLREQLLAVDYPRREMTGEVAPLLGVDFDAYLRNHPIYLEEEDIGHLLRQGFTLGGHGLDHPLFREVPPEEQLRQAMESTLWLRERFGVKQLLFSFPFSDEEVGAAFFRRVHPPEGEISLTFGISGLKKEAFPRHLHRIPMEKGDLSARSLIKEEYLYFLLKAPAGRNTIHRL
ncbi:MAG TPA: polysaccharide deacetylase family protein [Prolixibacteraceae bacterium]|jgi:peptidoglycan/xylan/chitin deacetylase (PgdA/CDA1 family)|nr:polysaccharide deacetylase family protein [Prolixibacteraceae bacterium]HRV88585.1 polysaccharide deacetylase family protein [Prolixibacteraceae bacterium]